MCDAALSPDGKVLVSGGIDRRALLWNLEVGEVLAELDHEGAIVESVAWSPDGDRVATGAQDRSIRVWNARERRGRAPSRAVGEGEGGAQRGSVGEAGLETAAPTEEKRCVHFLSGKVWAPRHRSRRTDSTRRMADRPRSAERDSSSNTRT